MDEIKPIQPIAQPSIAITDARISQGITVDPNDTEVSITPPAVQQTEMTLPDGTVISGDFTSTPPPTTTTLKEVNAAISNLQCEITTTQANLDALNAQLATQQALADQITAVVSPAPADPAQINTAETAQ